MCGVVRAWGDGHGMCVITESVEHGHLVWEHGHVICAWGDAMEAWSVTKGWGMANSMCPGHGHWCVWGAAKGCGQLEGALAHSPGYF